MFWSISDHRLSGSWWLTHHLLPLFGGASQGRPVVLTRARQSRLLAIASHLSFDGFVAAVIAEHTNSRMRPRLLLIVPLIACWFFAGLPLSWSGCDGHACSAASPELAAEGERSFVGDGGIWLLQHASQGHHVSVGVGSDGLAHSGVAIVSQTRQDVLGTVDA